MKHFAIIFPLTILDKDYEEGQLNKMILEKMKDLSGDESSISLGIVRVWRKL